MTSKSSRAVVRRIALAGCLVAAALSAPAHGQEVTQTLVLRTGLHLFSPRHSAVLTVSEIGGPRASAHVTIEFRDTSDRIVARTEGPLGRGTPVALEFRVAEDAGLVRLRFLVRITTPVGVVSTPMTVLEDLDVDTLVVGQRGVHAGRLPTGRDSPQTTCPGWSVTSFVAE